MRLIVWRNDVIDLFDPRSVPLWTAFFAGVVSVVGLVIAKEHRVSDFRQAWTDALRGEIAALIGRANSIDEWRWAISQGELAGPRRNGTTERGRTDPPRGRGGGYRFVHSDILRMKEALAKIELRLSIAVVTMFASAVPMTHYPEGVAYRLREGKPVRPRYQAPTPRTTTETARRAVSIPRITCVDRPIR